MPRLLELHNPGPSALDLLAEFEANQNKLKGVRVRDQLAVGSTEFHHTKIGSDAGLPFLIYSTTVKGVHDGLCLWFDTEDNQIVLYYRSNGTGLINDHGRAMPMPLHSDGHVNGRYDTALLLARYETAKQLFPAVNLMESHPSLLWTTSVDPSDATPFPHTA